MTSGYLLCRETTERNQWHPEIFILCVENTEFKAYILFVAILSCQKSGHECSYLEFHVVRIASCEREYGFIRLHQEKKGEGHEDKIHDNGDICFDACGR